MMLRFRWQGAAVTAMLLGFVSAASGADFREMQLGVTIILTPSRLVQSVISR